MLTLASPSCSRREQHIHARSREHLQAWAVWSLAGKPTGKVFSYARLRHDGQDVHVQSKGVQPLEPTQRWLLNPSASC